MTTTTAEATMTGPMEDDAAPLAKAEALVPLLRANAAAIEDGRRLTPEVHHALVEAGMYRVTMPPGLGNDGGTLPEGMRVLETLAKGDASTAWSVWSALGLPAASAFISEEGATEIFSAADACVVNSEAAFGRAVAVDGSYRVTGRWPFMSGVHQATHVGGFCFVFDGEEQRVSPSGEPAVIAPVWPIADATIIDTWDTTGLRGTGSDDVEVRDLFVPDHRVFDFTREPRMGLSPIQYVDLDNAGNVTLAAMALGIAQSALETFRALGALKKLADGEPFSTSPIAILALGNAEVRLAQARGHLYETTEMMWDELIEGAYVGDAWFARTALASVSAVDTAIDVVSALYRAAGAGAIFHSRPLDRCLRDIYTLGGHRMIQQANVLRLGGATFAGSDAAA